MNEVKISVIVCTYNSNKNNLINTLHSIIVQRNIDFEIIVTDDGSVESNKVCVMEYFKNHGFNNYQFIENKINKGTVMNIYSGLLASKGEYIYTISPGDYLYDEMVLCNLYDFVCKNKIDFCFGEAVYYKKNHNELEILPTQFPKLSNIYLVTNYNNLISNIGYFSGQHPVGATYLRKRTLFVSYMDRIVGKIKYLEDYPTTGMYLLEGNKLYTYGNPVIFYEYGNGVSTSGNEIWKSRLAEDIECTKTILSDEFKNNRIIKAKYVESKIQRIKYPLICAIGIYIKVLSILKKQKVVNYDLKIAKLRSIIS